MALGITLVVEVPIYQVLLHFALDVPAKPAALAGVGVNLFSHPLGLLVIGPAFTVLVGATGAVAIVEVWAWASEAVLLWVSLRRLPHELLLVSLVANGASFLLGVSLSGVVR